MFNCTRIKSVEYYEAQARQADADAEGLRPSETGRNGEKRDAVAYYTDNGAAEAPGQWYVRRKVEEMVAGAEKVDPETGEVTPVLVHHALATNPHSSPTPSPLAMLQHGEVVDGTVLRRLANARDPETGKPIENDRTGKPLRPLDKDGKPKGSVGYDIQISAPKSVSVLAAAADEETRAAIFAAHDRAVARALDFIVDEGMLYSRSGKGGHEREAVTEIAAARYRHFTSRAGDPQLHTHSVFLNMARRADGSMGTIDNQEVVRYGGAIAALYRTELAAILKEDFGLETVQDGRNFRVAGMSDSVLERFSKRRAMIEKEAQDKGFDTAKNRQAAQIAAFDTRGEKSDLPEFDTLEARWQRELAAEGFTGETLWESARAVSRDIRNQAAQARAKEVADAERRGAVPSAAPTLADRAMVAVDRLMANEAVFERRQLYRHVLEELQTAGVTAETALATIKEIEASGRIIRVGMDGNEPVYSTGAMVDLEKALLLDAVSRKDERDFVPADVLERILARFPSIKAEQENAVRHALNRDGVAVIEGLAGTGKSFATGALREIAEAAGFTVHGIAPSWKATDVLRIDAGLAEEYAKAVAGTVRKLEKGEIVWNDKTIVVVDEAGMVGTADMAALLRHAKAAGAKIIVQGDTRQLQPVVAGAPMKALADVLGAAEMQDIQRQKGSSEAEGEWMRAASVDFATGDPIRAIEAYDRAGAVNLIEDRDALIEQLVESYVADAAIPDFLVRDDGKPVTRAILTGWNIDVGEINFRVRASMQEQGMLQADAVEVQAIPRGGSKAQALALAVGDQVIFGETVELDRVTIRNADIGRIEQIEGDLQDPTITIALAKGQTITAKMSELVGKRGQDDETPAVPRLQHAYAMTIHASQGVTVDRSWVANIRGMGKESLYVAMTRHRQSVKLFAETGRVYDALAAKAGGKKAAVSSQGVALPEEDDDVSTGEVSPDDVKQALFAEGLKSDRKSNASDFVGNIREWAGLPQATPIETPAPVAETAPTVREKLAQASNFLGLRKFGKAPSSPTPQAKPSAGQDQAQRMENRKSAPDGYKSQWEPRGRITQEERDKMVRVDLMKFAQDHLGYKEAAKSLWGGREGFGAVFTKGGDGKDDIAITNKAGVFMWSPAKHSEGGGGMIWDLVARETGKSVGQAMHWLRDVLKTWTADPARKIITEAGKALKERDPEAGSKLRFRFGKMEPGPSPYLVQDRGLDPDMLRRFGADVRAEGDNQYAGSNKNGAAFAHRDATGKITSYVRRGYKQIDPDDGKLKSFRQHVKGGEPNLFQAGNRRDPSRIYVTESAIDSLSRYQLDGQPDLRKTLLTATDGQPSDRALEIYAELAKKNPDAEWHMGLDGDEAGRAFTEKVKEAIRQGNPDAKFVNRKPPAEFKDANDQLKGITRDQAEKIKLDEQAKIAEAEARRREEEERLRNAQDQDAPTYRPRMR